jgi:hypothetical protein
VAKPLLAPPPGPKTGSNRTLVIALVVAVVAAAVAVPKLVSSFADSDSPALAAPPKPAAAVESGEDASPEKPAEKPNEEAPAPPQAPKPTVETSETGEIEPVVKLRWSQFESGDRILATVKFANRSKKDVFLPASGEPNPGLAMVVVSSEGDEVRRVVESGKGDQLPRRLVKLASGFEIEIPLVVVAEDETPLPPGTYSIFAELRPDPRFVRLGLPVWKAAHGSVRSAKVPLVVTPKAK